MDLQKFSEKVQKNLAHRKLELSRLLMLTHSAHPDKTQEFLLCRTAIVFSYAHWEGFIKGASQLYIKYINAQQVPVSTLKSCLQAAHVYSHLSKAGNSAKMSFLGELLEKIDLDRKAIFSANPEKCIDTESNLSSGVFRSLVLGIGLNYIDAYSTRQAFIDEKLVFSRNQVVHGEMIPFEKVDAWERLDSVRLLIDMYADQLLDAARDAAYLSK
ncbi:MAE_28990/MAE_18760 family HEPN-like nuclease [Streptomyces sp. NPDC057094]|uniref:MAE_28990/MAE_18760 family HEPN-like nuclease n=1 Tax=Streptomyces sp. NPDC057094 TaxID=3346018 RepID=UPI0036335B8D